jgi:cytochrome c oxidase subunit 2
VLQHLRYLFLRGRIYTLIAGGLLLSSCAGSPSTLDPHGADADRIAHLSWLMFGIATVVFVIVTVLLLIALLRKHRTDEKPPTHSTERRLLVSVVIGGGLIPAVVLLIVVALGILIENASADASAGDVTIEVIGHRWWWEIHYPEQNIVTANELHIPAGKAVQVKLTSADVIHSFWVPQLHGKLDLIPGQTNTFTLESDQIGTFDGFCAEYCGLQHAHMAFRVIADSTDDFNIWLQNQSRPAPDPDVNQADLLTGQQVFLGSSCVYCHAIQGTNASGTLGPDLTHIASRQTLGAGALPNNRGNLAGWIINSQTTKPGNLMPPMDIDPSQLPALLDYLESLT